MAGYSGTPLVRKLGIAPGQRVLVDGSDLDLDWPDGVTVHRRLQRSAPYDVVMCFCTEFARLAGRWPVLHPLTTPAGALWVMWPKPKVGWLTPCRAMKAARSSNGSPWSPGCGTQMVAGP